MRFSFVLFATFLISAMATPVFGCSCARLPPGENTARQFAESASEGSGAIFEGKVEGVELRWKLAEGHVGDVVPADFEQEPPELETSFEVLRSYGGVDGKQVRVRTGIGGGDCGFDFETSEIYLVFAYKGHSGELSTGICSSTALIGESQSNLAYLRGEAEVPESNQKKLLSDKGGICGQLIFDNPTPATDGEILLFRVGDKSLVPSDEIQLGADGSFCNRDLRPGKYVVVFRDGTDESPELTFYPGVIKPSEATAVEVTPRETVSHLLFKVPSRQTYTVKGKILAFNRSKQKAVPKVMLVSAAERFLLMLGYSADVATDGTFTLLHILPGKYWAVVTVDSDDTTKWSTRIIEVNVDGDVSDLSPELFAN
jgi:hypothetical protein